jgi:mannitol-1-/sugar-/sorbitol-6-phosphatase
MPELIVAALISDMDGVLVDTGGIYDRHWESWAEQHSVSHRRIASVHFGRPAAETIRIVAPELDAVAEARRFNDGLAADPDAAGVVAIPGAIELMRQVPDPIRAIATSAPGVMARRWLDHIGCPQPAVLVTVEDVPRGKPAPDPYLRAAELLGIAPGHCLVIEDSPVGITAAKAAGAQVLAVLTTHQPEELEAADHLVGSLANVAVSVTDAGLVVSWVDARKGPTV